jgi:hypothetical protein
MSSAWRLKGFSKRGCGKMIWFSFNLYAPHTCGGTAETHQVTMVAEIVAPNDICWRMMRMRHQSSLQLTTCDPEKMIFVFICE